MTEPDDRITDDELEQLFAAARKDQQRDVSATLRMRVLADAARLAMVPAASPVPVRRPVNRWLERFLWPAGLAAASVAGVVIGQNPVIYGRVMSSALFDGAISYELAHQLPVLAGLLGGL